MPLLPPRLLLHAQLALLPARFDGWNSSSPRLYHLSSLLQKEHHRYHHQNHHHLLSPAPLLPPPSQSPRRPSASPSPPPLCVSLSTERVNEDAGGIRPALSCSPTSGLSFRSTRRTSSPLGVQKSLARDQTRGSSCAFLGTAREMMIGLFSVTLSFERSSAFFSFAFSALAFIFFIRRKKVFCEERETLTRRAFFSLFSSLFFLARKQKKLIFLPSCPQREKRYKNTEHRAVKEMPLSSSSSSSSSSRNALFRFALSSVVLSRSSSRGRAAGADGVFFKNNNAKRFLSLFSTSSSLKDT